MHLGACVIQGRDAEEAVVLLLAVMLLLHDRRMHDSRMCVKDRLGESGCAGGEVDCSVILICHFYIRSNTGIVCCLGYEIFSKRRASGSIVQKKSSAGDAVGDLLYTADEFRAEDQDVRFRKFYAVLDLISAVAEVQGNGYGAGLEDAKIDRQPVQTVHEQNSDLVALDDSSGDQHVCHAVCLLVEYRPCDLLAAGNFVKGLDEFIFFPGCESRDLDVRIQFYESHIIGPLFCVSLQKLCNRH